LFGGAESLVGDADSLFGDADGGVADGGGPPGGAFHVDDDDEFFQALANSVQQSEGNTQMELESTLKLNGTANPETSPAAARVTGSAREPGGNADGLSRSDQPETLTNGLPHAEELESGPPIPDTSQPSGPESYIVRNTTFLAASIDGTIRVWDRRQADPVARISPRNVPPWCMSACWSPDGNYIYAGRRNGTVEEFSLHKGLRSSVRSFRFPQGSGPVTALKSMPNGRHLVCASHDILRLYDLKAEPSGRHSTVPFLIIPGHRTGVISQLYLDPACRFMVSISGNRGWEGNTSEVLLGYEINA